MAPLYAGSEERNPADLRHGLEALIAWLASLDYASAGNEMELEKGFGGWSTSRHSQCVMLVRNPITRYCGATRSKELKESEQLTPLGLTGSQATLVAVKLNVEHQTVGAGFPTRKFQRRYKSSCL